MFLGFNSDLIGTPAVKGGLLPQHIPFSSLQGRLFLEEAKYKAPFFDLVQNFEPQVHSTFCAIASSVVAFNTLQKEKKYHQHTLLNPLKETLKPLTEILGNVPGVAPGLSLSELKDIIESLSFSCKKTFADAELTEEALRSVIRDHLTSLDSVILVNFDYGQVIESRGGHFSPISAYHEASDRVLVLDVARHKNIWFWIEMKNLLRAMNTLDQGSYRGLLRVSA